MDFPAEEPLNLSVRKMPVAIVAPFSRTEMPIVADKIHIETNNNNNNNNNEFSVSNIKCTNNDLPEDLSLKNLNRVEYHNHDHHQCLDLTKISNLMDINNKALNPREQLRNYLLKSDDATKNRNVYTESNQKEELSSSSSSSTQHHQSSTDLYSFMNSLDNKFLTAWYVNSLMNHHHHHQQSAHQFLNLPCTNNNNNNNNINNKTTDIIKPNSPSTNRILNNLLEKKPYATYTFPNGFDALIKNEMQIDDAAAATVENNNLIVENNRKIGSQDHHHHHHHQNNNKNGGDGVGKNNQDNEKKKPHIKKPLNAFMLYMKEMRAKVVAECTLKESAAINQILGRRWHALGREEQAKYYELARRERQLHMQLYPDWSSRANATRGKKRKRKQDPQDGGNGMKKCRARYGLDQQSQWCKPCRRKKKCIRYMESGGESNDGNQSDDNLGSCGSMGDANTPPEDDNESLSQSLSSPGGLSGLSSLTSPGGMILPSPSTSVASPSVSVASPYMLQSPLTPHHDSNNFDVKLPPPQLLLHPSPRNPVGTNPHDINNPLSVNQLTGQCAVRSNNNEPNNLNDNSNSNKETTRSIISVT